MTDDISVFQRKAARAAGLAYLLSFAIVVATNFGALFPLFTGDPAQIARSILAHETLFRVGVVGQLLYCIGVLVVTAALYVVLRPVGETLALLAAAGRLVHAFTWLLVSLNLLTALRLLSQPDFAHALTAEQLPALARLYVSGSDQYYVGLLFWSLGSTVAAFLWLRSRYVPIALAVVGIAAGAWGAACCVALFIFPGFPKIVGLWWFDMPLVLFEIGLSFLLLFGRLRVRGADAGRT